MSKIDNCSDLHKRILKALYAYGKLNSSELTHHVNLANTRAAQCADVAFAAKVLRDDSRLVYGIKPSQTEYVVWELSPAGRAAVLEWLHGPKEVPPEKAAPKKRQPKKAAVPKRQAEYILWSPGSSKPPRVVHKSKEEAEQVAREMATKLPGQVFYVCELGFAARLVEKHTITRVLEVSNA
ncbi:hypothetical protein SVOphi44_15 [Psuedomonas phage SVOphi44]